MRLHQRDDDELVLVLRELQVEEGVLLLHGNTYDELEELERLFLHKLRDDLLDRWLTDLALFEIELEVLLEVDPIIIVDESY